MSCRVALRWLWLPVLLFCLVGPLGAQPSPDAGGASPRERQTTGTPAADGSRKGDGAAQAGKGDGAAQAGKGDGAAQAGKSDGATQAGKGDGAAQADRSRKGEDKAQAGKGDDKTEAESKKSDAAVAASPQAEKDSSPAPEGASPSPAAPVLPIPLADVVAANREVDAFVRDVEAMLDDTSLIDEIREKYRDSLYELNNLLETKNGDQTTSSDTLRQRQLALLQLEVALQGYEEELRHAEGAANDFANSLKDRQARWQATAELARTSGAAEVVVLSIDSVNNKLAQTDARLQKRIGRLFELQNTVAKSREKCGSTAAMLKNERANLSWGQAFTVDAPIWAIVGDDSVGSLIQSLVKSMGDEWNSLVEFCSQRAVSLLIWLIVYGCVFLGVRSIHRLSLRWNDHKAELHHVLVLLERPNAVALLLTVVFFMFGNALAPRLFLGIVGAIVVIPAVFLLRDLLDDYLRPLLSAFIFLYLVDLFAMVTESVVAAQRLILFAETAGVIFFLLLYRRPRSFAMVSEEQREKVMFYTRAAIDLVLLSMIVSTVANIVGYWGLAAIVGQAAFRSAYVAIFLIAAMQVIRGVILFLLHIPPLNKLNLVNRFRKEIVRRTNFALQILAGLAWVLFVCDAFFIDSWLHGVLVSIFSFSIKAGNIELSVRGLVGALVCLWLFVWINHFVQAVFTQDIVPRLSISRGSEQILKVALKYITIGVGIVLAGNSLGIDMSQITILFGALSVGIGFGLQNIVNNFVSGLILLFEPRLTVGDAIEFDGVSGTLSLIGLRASTVALGDGRELIVPNGDLITRKVVSGAFVGARGRRMDFNFSLVGNVDGAQVKQLLEKSMAENERVCADPAPVVHMLGFFDGLPRFEAVAWTRDIGSVSAIKSDLLMAAYRVLTDNGFIMASSRQELHLVQGETPSPQARHDALEETVASEAEPCPRTASEDSTVAEDRTAPEARTAPEVSSTAGYATISGPETFS